MPKQRSKMTVADVKKMLQQQGLTTDPTAVTRQAQQTQDTPEVDEEGNEVAPKRNVIRDNRTPADTSRSGATRTPALADAKQDADAPLTVTEGNKTSTVKPEGQEKGNPKKE